MSTRYFLPDQTRRATILAHGAPLALHTDALPVLEGTEVLVRVHCCGVCHTDVHLRAGYYDIGEGREWRFNEHGVHPPITPGHEIYGEIIAASPRGEGVRRRGVIYPWIGCGECRTCTSGNEHFCAKHRFVGMRRAGGFADYVILPHARYVLDTGSLEPARAATLACAGLTAYSALKKLGDQRRGGWIGVIGAGGLGLHGIQIAKRIAAAFEFLPQGVPVRPVIQEMTDKTGVGP